MLSPEQSQKILQVGPAATIEDVEAAYRKWHTFWYTCQHNVSRADQRELAARELQRIEAAHRVLSEYVAQRQPITARMAAPPSVVPPPLPPPLAPRAKPPALRSSLMPPPALHAVSVANPGDFSPERISIRTLEQQQHRRRQQQRRDVGMVLLGLATGVGLFLAGQWLITEETTDLPATEVATSTCCETVQPLRCRASPRDAPSASFLPVCPSDVLVPAPAAAAAPAPPADDEEP